MISNFNEKERSILEGIKESILHTGSMDSFLNSMPKEDIKYLKNILNIQSKAIHKIEKTDITLKILGELKKGYKKLLSYYNKNKDE